MIKNAESAKCNFLQFAISSRSLLAYFFKCTNEKSGLVTLIYEWLNMVIFNHLFLEVRFSNRSQHRGGAKMRLLFVIIITSHLTKMARLLIEVLYTSVLAGVPQANSIASRL